MPRQEQTAEPPLPAGYVAQDWGIPEKSLAERTGSTIRAGGRLAADFGIGVMKGVGQSVEDWRQTSGKLAEMLPRGGRPVEPVPPVPPQYYSAQNPAQGTGKNVEQFGEYILGGVGAARMGGGILSQMVKQGASAAGISGMHGASPQEAAGTGITTGLGAGAVGLGMKAAGGLVRAAGQRFQDSTLGQVLGRFGRPRAATPPGEAPPPVYDAQFVDSPIDDVMDAQFRTVPTPTAPPSHQIGAGRVIPAGPAPTTPPTALPPPQTQRLNAPTPQGQLPPGPAGPPQLPPAPGAILPRGTQEIPGDPRLPSVYQQTPGPTPPPGVMGRIQEGTPGPIPTHGEQTITGMNLPLERVPKGQPKAGTFRRVTAEEATRSTGTAGRTARDLPKPEASPKRRVYDRLIELLEEEAKQAEKPTSQSLLGGGKLNKQTQATQKLRDELEAEFLLDKLVRQGGLQPKSPTGIERRLSSKPLHIPIPKKPPKK